MPEMSFTIRAILLLLALCAPVSGHFSFNLVVDAEGNVYFLEIFNNSLLKVTPDGQVSELVDLRKISPEERLHALAVDPDGHLYLGGYLQEKIWRVSPSGKVSTVYAHNRRNLVRVGEFVERGQVIGEVGRTGRATTDHLHFEVRRDGKPRDPLQYLP